ncbi:hypothetical protein ACI3LY_004673 [Candidozyma auris]|uniref:Major facilitator superfamily (MFS) profile domain-containing protein n=2 Tax=Candidozyma auris TaxID=498019 RepID=A0AB36VZ35_CANAR|nr:hypothetical protein QG37_07508 [[Candida] auris]PIS48701.1 hypothetical protein B9J08_005403 [[Candida] auris]PIS49313.1 hypothetical protein CJI97_005486 [[Candida] auris]QWW24556.1 hypothetical protein CA7LBN_003413 [[Candida] auris]
MSHRPSSVASLASSVESLNSEERSVQAPQEYHEPKSSTSPSAISKDEPQLPDLEQGQTHQSQAVSEKMSLKEMKSHVVPRRERRGLLAQLSIVPELDDARNYTPNIKLLIVIIVAFAGITGPMGTSIILPAVGDVSRSLHTSSSIVNVSVGIYLISLGVFPIWWSNFSEKHGRRSVYVVSFIWFFAFSIGCCLAPSIGALIVLRLLAGVGASAVQACGAATVSDLYIQEERGYALGLFYLGPLLGPFLSPIIGGAVAEAWGWRATMWVMVIFTGINVLSLVFFLPETLRQADSMAAVRERLKKELGSAANGDPNAPTEEELTRFATNLSQNSSLRRDILHDETACDPVMPTLSRLTTGNSAYSKKIKEQELLEAEEADPIDHTKWSHILYDYFIRPTHAVILLAYPPVTLTICYSSISFCVIYFFNITITEMYAKEPYNFSTVIVGLMYIPNSVTYLMASIFGGKWNDWLIRRSGRRNNGELKPESRISWNIVTAITLYPAACLIFGWCLKYGEHWVTPLIGTALFGFASMLTIGVTVTYLIDVLPGKGATGVALNNLVRQILAAAATFVTVPLINALGTGVLFSIIAGVITVSGVSLLYLKHHGGQLRERYDIMDYYKRL